MKRISASFCLLAMVWSVIIPVWCEATSYYMRADGTAANKAAATACSAASSAMSIATHNSETFAAGDILTLCDTGGVYRSGLTGLVPPSSGSTGAPITYQAASGQSPIFNGANLITGPWTDMGSNVWRTAFTGNNSTRMAFFDGARGTLRTSSGACLAPLDYYYDDTGKLFYMYATADPSTLYSVVEATVQPWGFYVNGKTDITVTGVILKHQLFGVYGINGSNNLTVSNNSVSYGAVGLVFDGCPNVLANGNTIAHMQYFVAGEDGGGIVFASHNCANFQVINNNISYTDGYGIAMDFTQTTGGTIANNTVHHAGQLDTANEPYGIFATINTAIYNNDVSYTGAAGAAIEHHGINAYGAGMNIYKNKVYNNVGCGIYVQGAASAFVNTNLVYGNYSDGIHMHSTGITASPRNSCTHNTIYGNNTGAGTANLYIYDFDNLDVYGNVISNGGAAYEIYVGSNTASQDINYNLYYHPAGGNYFYYKVSGAIPYPSWRLNGNPRMDTASPTPANPLFNNAAAFDFSLLKTSPGINASRHAPTALGSELITTTADRDFSSDTGFWTKGVGVAINSGVATFTAVASGLGLVRNENNLTTNSIYLFTYTISGYASGSMKIRACGVDGITRTYNGTFTEQIQCASAATNGEMFIAGAANTTLSLDNVSVKEVTSYSGNPTTDYRGRGWRGLPDIGAYEFKPVTNGGLAVDLGLGL